MKSSGEGGESHSFIAINRPPMRELRPNFPQPTPFGDEKEGQKILYIGSALSVVKLVKVFLVSFHVRRRIPPSASNWKISLLWCSILETIHKVDRPKILSKLGIANVLVGHVEVTLVTKRMHQLAYQPGFNNKASNKEAIPL